MVTVLKDHSKQWTNISSHVPSEGFIICNYIDIFFIPKVLKHRSTVYWYRNGCWCKFCDLLTVETNNQIAVDAINIAYSGKLYIFTRTGWMIAYHTLIQKCREYPPHDANGFRAIDQISTVCVCDNHIHVLGQTLSLRSPMIDHFVINLLELDIHRKPRYVLEFELGLCKRQLSVDWGPVLSMFPLSMQEEQFVCLSTIFCFQHSACFLNKVHTIHFDRCYWW